ncbi:MAG: sigma-70 family RNA polymerase sigma factor [Hyphomicrobiales bacterium]
MQRQGPSSGEFPDQLLAAIPGLRAFGLSLTARADQADDLVQETLMKAWHHKESFEAGSNLRAWLYTILRNEFYTQMRKRRREIEDADGAYSSKVATPGEQEGHLAMADLRIALAQLPADQREAVILVGASGFSYQEVAEICGVAIGTVKSRVSRAREKLAILLGAEQVASAAIGDSQNRTGSPPEA